MLKKTDMQHDAPAAMFYDDMKHEAQRALADVERQQQQHADANLDTRADADDDNAGRGKNKNTGDVAAAASASASSSSLSSSSGSSSDDSRDGGGSGTWMGQLTRCAERDENRRRAVPWSVLTAFTWLLGGFAIAMLQLYLKVRPSAVPVAVIYFVFSYILIDRVRVYRST